MRENQCRAVQVLRDVLSGESLNACLRSLWTMAPPLAPDDRGAVQDLCYGTLRHLAELRAFIDLMSNKPIVDEALRLLLCVALYQLAYTRNLQHAVVNEAVEAARLLGIAQAKGLVNALLRRFQRDQEDLRKRIAHRPSKRYSYPDWWVSRLQFDYPDTFHLILEEGNRRPGMTLRVNRRRLSREDYLTALREVELVGAPIGEDGVLLERPVRVELLPGFERGWASVQDFGAQLAASFLDAASGMRVCDACAAPGGKAAHLLEQSDVEVTALEVDSERMTSLSQTLQRLGLKATLHCADAAVLDTWWDGKPFQRVLLDAPCSASGVVRRHPDSKWLRRAEDIPRFVGQQRRLLDTLWQVVEPGGKLLYVTCSVFKAENEDMVQSFLDRQAGVIRLPSPTPLDATGRLLPSATHDGFFYAVLQKTH